MIGIIAREEERPAIEEFFELFKTPWQYFDPGRPCNVAISTGEMPPRFEGKLLVIFSSRQTSWDAANGIEFCARFQGGFVTVKNEKLPIYGPIATSALRTGCIGAVCGDQESAAIETSEGATKVVRIGYDLFQEVAHLLSNGQPAQNALFPALDLHIAILRRLIAEAGLAVVEIAPAPAGFPYISCLTHDVDFFKIRQHKFDRPMMGFLYRATLETALEFARGRASASRLAANWLAALKLPLVHLGLCADFWVPFNRYLEIEKGKPSTYFVIPFKKRNGRAPQGQNSDRRATQYDIEDVAPWVRVLKNKGCEVAVHGIDAWDDSVKGREELCRIASLTGETESGVRMHWLYYSGHSPEVLEEAGYSYDSTCGYNNAIGFRAGTSQAFKPLAVSRLLEIPLHVQDTALFFRRRMHLSDSQARDLCRRVLSSSQRHGGVFTLLWHDRSMAPERLWNTFYEGLLAELEVDAPWFATARDAARWFRKRRAARFLQRGTDQIEVQLEHVKEDGLPGLSLRVSSIDSAGLMRTTETPLRAGAKMAPATHIPA